MAVITRMTIAFGEGIPERLKQVAEKLDISYARLLACLLAMPDEQIKEAIDANYAKLFVPAAERNAKKKELLKKFKGMSEEQLVTLLASANKGN